MSKKQSSRGRAQDRSKVAGGQQHEVKYEASKSGVSSNQVKRAIASAGNSRDKVRKALRK